MLISRELDHEKFTKPTLFERIGNRTVIIDENLLLVLAFAFRERGLSVRHVSEMHLPMSDTHQDSRVRYRPLAY